MPERGPPASSAQTLRRRSQVAAYMMSGCAAWAVAPCGVEMDRAEVVAAWLGEHSASTLERRHDDESFDGSVRVTAPLAP